MKSPLKILWISGWGICPKNILSIVKEYFPFHHHTVIHPKESFTKNPAFDTFDVIVGYSLGAFLLLQSPPPPSKKLILLAPFVDLKTESKKGGKIHLTQLRFLERNLKINPVAAINDFYQRAQISLPPLAQLPYPLEDLSWGIHQLIYPSPYPFPELKNPSQILIGDSDPLIHAPTLNHFIPNLSIIKNLSHDFPSFLQHIIFSNNTK